MSAPRRPGLPQNPWITTSIVAQPGGAGDRAKPQGAGRASPPIGAIARTGFGRSATMQISWFGVYARRSGRVLWTVMPGWFRGGMPKEKCGGDPADAAPGLHAVVHARRFALPRGCSVVYGFSGDGVEE
jgi:hypothetical protein